ncbi:hypothetical protein L5G32_16145 [Gordonia sp. HY002]|uniref:hypothetical protein n=1 Tax=Gordonia zhenghanii TaxID=2911516 RepID=UPI001EEFFC57|nr:hypothetical protein [Gordonia zhenghanii]MCF8571800.1 hypothetical protein [Gordonia zhenghanii]MCF8604812.1 hypothetical protein [Gordonia zhenghanii]
MRALRIAVESDDADWTELTDSSAGAPPTRIRSSSLGEAAAAAARSARPVFVDIDVHVADTVTAAFAEYADANPGWAPGARTGTIVHPGTVATLVRLLHDIEATGVADGVTLRGPHAHALIDRLTPDLVELLGVGARAFAYTDAR